MALSTGRTDVYEILNILVLAHEPPYEWEFTEMSCSPTMFLVFAVSFHLGSILDCREFAGDLDVKTGHRGVIPRRILTGGSIA
jgi:hypothetical protein